MEINFENESDPNVFWFRIKDNFGLFEKEPNRLHNVTPLMAAMSGQTCQFRRDDKRHIPHTYWQLADGNLPFCWWSETWLEEPR